MVRNMYFLRVTRPKDLDRVCLFLRAARVDTRARDDATLTVSIPEAQTDLHERRELAGYIATWNALNPASHVELFEH
jgi:hypothetical protein